MPSLSGAGAPPPRGPFLSAVAATTVMPFTPTPSSGEPGSRFPRAVTPPRRWPVGWTAQLLLHARQLIPLAPSFDGSASPPLIAGAPTAPDKKLTGAEVRPSRGLVGVDVNWLCKRRLCVWGPTVSTYVLEG